MYQQKDYLYKVIRSIWRACCQTIVDVSKKTDDSSTASEEGTSCPSFDSPIVVMTVVKDHGGRDHAGH